MASTAKITRSPTPLAQVSKSFRRSTQLVRAAASTQGTLNRVKLGTSDLSVTEICLGCMMFGSMDTKEESYKILDAAFEKGVNFFDTAEAYPIPPNEKWVGRSSEILGSWLKKQNFKREDVVIATKVAGFGKADSIGFIAANRSVPPSKKIDVRLDAGSIRAATEGELRRIGIDYIDLMQFHGPDRYVPSFGRAIYEKTRERDSIPFEEQVQGIADMIEEGKVRYWGLSNESSYGTTMMCVTADKLGCPRPITIQNSFSLVHRSFETELAEVCSERHFNIPLLPWSPAAGGVLSGKYMNGSMPEGSRFSAYGDRFFRFMSPGVADVVRDYVEIANKFDVTPMQLAYMFCKSRFYVGSTIIGARSTEQLDEDLYAFHHDLPEEALQAIDEVHQKQPNPQNMYV